MNFDQSRQIILTATALRAQQRYDECIEHIQSNIQDIDPDVLMNARLEIFAAAKAKGDLALARQTAQTIALEDPNLPSIQDFI